LYTATLPASELAGWKDEGTVSFEKAEETQTSGDKLERFGASMPAGLLEQFDSLVAKRGYGNRSEAIRDLVRDTLVDGGMGVKRATRLLGL